MIRSPLVRKLAVGFALSAAGATALVDHEGGFVQQSYLDTGKVWTVCAGHTKTAGPGQYRTQAMCERLLKEDVREAEVAVRKYTLAPITQTQYDVLVDFTFNVGVSAYRDSTLLRKLNAGDCKGAAAQFPRWNQDNGKVVRGLVNRRAAERALFEPDCP